MSNLREIDCSTTPSALRGVLLHRPDAHPFWHTYMVSVVHLRQLEGARAPYLAFPDASHEISIFALDPASVPDPSEPSRLRPMMPPNLAYQLRRKRDPNALELFGAFVVALSSRALSPDTDHRRCQLAWLEGWVPPS